MTTQTKHVLYAIGAALAAYVLYSVYQAFAAGERTIAGLITAPFSAAKAVWTAITSLFTSTPSASVPTLTPLTPAQLATPGGQFIAASENNTALTATANFSAPTDQACRAAK